MANIKIGDNNKFSGVNAIGQNNKAIIPNKSNWFSRHPLLTGVISSLIVAIITSFWWWQPLVKLLGISK